MTRIMLFIACIVLAVPSVAQRTPAPMLELWMLLDDSDSMYDDPELAQWKNPQRISNREAQLYGHIGALRNPEVRSLLVHGQVLVHIVLWAETQFEITPFGGVYISSDREIDYLISLLETYLDGKKESLDISTYRAEAIEYILDQPKRAPKVVIDFSTDESEFLYFANELYNSRIRAERENVTINVITIHPKAREQSDNWWYIADVLVTHDGFAHISELSGYTTSLIEKLTRELLIATR